MRRGGRRRPDLETSFQKKQREGSLRQFHTALICLLTVCLSIGVSFPATAAQSAWTADSVLHELDRTAKEFHSLSADVQRTKVTVVVNDHSTESGRIEVRGDDKMRIDLTEPDPRTILRDGDHLYLYNPKIRQVDEYDLSKHRDLVDQFWLLGFGTSGDTLKKNYLVTLPGRRKPRQSKSSPPRTDSKGRRRPRPNLQDRIVAGRRQLAPCPAAILRNRLRRLFHHSLHQHQPQRSPGRLDLQAPLARGRDQSQAWRLNSAFFSLPKSSASSRSSTVRFHPFDCLVAANLVNRAWPAPLAHRDGTSPCPAPMLSLS